MKRLVCAYLCIALLAGLAGCGVTKESYLAKGNAFFDAGKYDDASLNYRKAIQKDTNFGEAYYRLGLTAIKFWTRTEFHGCNDLKKKINPTRVPIGQKESIRWLENLRQSTALLNDPQRCIHIGDRESPFTNFSVPHSRWARIFWYAPVWTASPETVQLRSPMR